MKFFYGLAGAFLGGLFGAAIPISVATLLDGYAPKHLAPETSYFAYRHIEGNWYLEYDCEPE